VSTSYLWVIVRCLTVYPPDVHPCEPALIRPVPESISTDDRPQRRRSDHGPDHQRDSVHLRCSATAARVRGKGCRRLEVEVLRRQNHVRLEQGNRNSRQIPIHVHSMLGCTGRHGPAVSSGYYARSSTHGGLRPHASAVFRQSPNGFEHPQEGRQRHSDSHSYFAAEIRSTKIAPEAG
jgi:hypothetical protein